MPRHKQLQDEVTIQMKHDVVEPTRNLFLSWAKLYGKTKKGYVWLEILDDADSFHFIVDIHLTAKYFAERFQARCASISLSVVQINRLFHSTKYILSVFADQELSKSEIECPSQSTNEALECFAHFTYENSDKMLLVIDLRPLQLGANKFLITEPVVFSLIPGRFSSADLGLKGIEQFKIEHQCNKLCNELALKRLNI